MKQNIKIYFLLFLILFLFGFYNLYNNPVKSYTKSDEECFICHEDQNLTMKKEEKKVSLYVNQKEFKASVHNSLYCNNCHIDYNPEQIPHNPQNNIVNCLKCHDNIEHNPKDVHRNIKCGNCHDYHYVKFAKNLSQNQNEFCLQCHKSKDVQSFKTGLHSKKNVKCPDCHNSGHNVLSIKNKDVSNVCAKCHWKSKNDFDKSIHGILMNNGNKNAPDCADCHGVHKIINNKMSIESQACLKCHLDEKLYPEEKNGSAKSVSKYNTSIHASIQKNGKVSAGCVDCHGSHVIQPENHPESSTGRTRMTETCGKCHLDVAKSFYNSQHGIELLNNNPSAPTCTDCHGEHDIKQIVESDNLSKLNQIEICLKCHNNQKLSKKNFNGEEIFVSDYKNSYHYVALKEGKNSASCTDCHGSHEMKKLGDVTSLINEKNLQNTCGQTDCHLNQLALYKGSIHEKAITEKLNFDSPSCTDCHGSHQIMKMDETINALSNSEGLVQLCSGCHNSVEMLRNNNLPEGKLESYMNSFHGLAMRGGSKVAADCGSCHHYHNIRPSTDSLSTIHATNLSKTCGKCHPGVESTLLNTKIHLSENYDESPVLFWIQRIYLILIIGIVGAMFLHNLFDLIKKLKSKRVNKD